MVPAKHLYYPRALRLVQVMEPLNQMELFDKPSSQDLLEIFHAIFREKNIVF